MSYEQLKDAIAESGLPVSEVAGFQGIDWTSYQKFTTSEALTSGEPLGPQLATEALYGAAYPAVLPQSVADAAGIEKPEVLPTPPRTDTWRYGGPRLLPPEARNGNRMLFSVGNSADGFVTLTDGDITLAIALRYRRSGTPIAIEGLSAVFPAVDAQGNAWAFVPSISRIGDLPILDAYAIQLSWHTVSGMASPFSPLSLYHDGNKYVAGGLAIDVGREGVAQTTTPALTAANYPAGNPALVGRYVLRIQCLRQSDNQMVSLDVDATAY